MFFTKPIRKVALYIRVSTRMQGEAGSLATQLKKLSDYCERFGYSFSKNDIFSDEDSGGKSNRVGYQKLKDAVKTKKYDAIITWSISRISRNLLELLSFIKECVENETQVIFIANSINYNTIEGRALIQVMGMVEEMRRYLTSEETSSNMKQHAKSTRYLGGDVFPWFKVVDYGNMKLIEKNDTTWEYEREKFLNIKKLGSLTSVSRTYKIPLDTLRKQINSNEIIGDRSFGKKKMNLLTNRRENKQNFQVEKNVFPALLSQEEQKEILQIISTNRRGGRKGKLNQYLFSGLLYCNLCPRAKKRKLGGNKFTKRGKTYYYYMCEHCSRRLNVEKADPIIINNILELDELKILDKANLLMFDLLDGISTLQKDIENLKDEQDKLLDKILNITIENLEIKTKLEKKIEKEIDSLDKIISDKNKKIELLRIQLNNKQKNSIDSDALNKLRYILLNKTPEDHPDIREMINLLGIKIHVKNYERMLFDIRLS